MTPEERTQNEVIATLLDQFGSRARVVEYSNGDREVVIRFPEGDES